MNQRIRLTKQLLHEAVLHELENVSVDKVTVVALCARSGINRSTFYRYYSTPGDVVEEIEQDILKDIRQIMDKIVPGSDATYLRQMDAVYEYLYRNMRTIRLLMKSVDFGLTLLEHTMQTTGLMSRQLERLDEQGRQMAATFLLHGAYSVIRQWLMAENPMPPIEFGTYMRLILRSVML